MTALTRFWIILTVLFLSWPIHAAENTSERLILKSPDSRLQVIFHFDGEGRPIFEVAYGNTQVTEGILGLEFAGFPPLEKNFRINDIQRAHHDETYAIPVGKTSSARDYHNELIVSLVESVSPYRELNVAFRAFNDGIAFRYRIPEQKMLDEFVLTEEKTRLNFSADPTAHVLPLNSYTTSYEQYYQTMPVSAISATMLLGMPALLERTLDERKIWIAITEANLSDYAGMYLSGFEGAPGTLAAKLSPLPGREDGAKVLGKAPHSSPWRVLMIADDLGRLIESNILFNLNDPIAIEDPSWIQPGKTTFPWWNHYVLEGVGFEPGVNTATMKYYIDFCAEQGIPYHSLDGLEIAWYGGPIQPNGPTDVTTPASSIDMPELLRYAKEKGVRLRLWMHWKALLPQIDQAFATYEKWGIEGVMVDFMDRDDQEMVRFYHEMAEKAAKHHLTLTLHGAYKPTGMERTWPNVLNHEAVLNQEYNKWQSPSMKGTPPEHNLNVAFIRTLAGPLDYHHGGMRNVLPESFQYRDVAPPVQGTRGHQLAMYIVYEDYLPMMADSPSAYRGQPGLKFIVDIPTTWDETHVLNAEMNQCLILARRKGDDWYFGGMTANEGQTLDLPLHFLGDGTFTAELYLDEPTQGPTSLTHRNESVTSKDRLQVTMPRAGGFVARLRQTE